MTGRGTPRDANRASTGAIVLVPGIGMSHRYNARLRRALGERLRPRQRSGPGSATCPSGDPVDSSAIDRVRLLSFDLPGFAGRRRPAERLSVGDYAAIVSSELDARGVTGATLVGHSMGAQFAAEVARTRPDLASHLVLMAPVADPARRTARQQTLDLARNAFSETPSSTAVIATDFLRTDPRWFFAELRAMLDYDIAPAVASVPCPVLVLRGARDPIARREWCVRLARSAPAGRFAEVPGAGHIVQHSDPDVVAAHILTFLSSPS